MDIKKIKEAVEKIADEFAINRVILFGSQANGKSRPESDIDLIIEFRGPVTLITLALVGERLEDLLHRHVDIIHGPIQEDDLLPIDEQIEIYVV